MNRSSKLAVLVALAVGSAPAFALNLGQIQVKSALDRPLVAIIPLHEDFSGEAKHLTVTLAPAAAFTRAGISRASLKVPLTFTVTTNAQGQKVIRVTSKAPVREPYLDFLVQVTWPKGKLLREYVVLLDPLSMSAAAPTVVPASAPPTAAQVASQPPVAAAPPPAPAPAPSAPPANPSPSAGAQQVGPVKPGETLSHIAQTHAISGVSYQQMLLALKAANPKAFFRDNVNALMAGSILRMPTRTQALAVTPTAAIAAVRQQNQAWQAVRAASPTLVASAGGASEPVNRAAAGLSGGDRLKLVPPKAGSPSAGAAAGGPQATITQLRQDLARSKESLSSQKQASADLSSRVTALQKIADKNKRLLGLKNAQIAELQNKLAQARKAAGLPATTPTPAPAKGGVATAGSIAAVAPASAASRVGTTTVGAAATAHAGGALASTPEPVAATHGAVQAKAPTSAVRPSHAKAVPARPAGSAAVPWYEQLWPRIVLAIIIIVLLITWFMRRRRKASRAAAKPSIADSFADTPFGREAGASAAVASEAEDKEDTSPVYTVDDDGEDELLAQLSEHPDSVDLHLELVSLYYARGDVAQFENAAEAMHPHVIDDADPEWQEVVAMGRELSPDHPLFAQADDGSAGAALAAGDDELARDADWQHESVAEAPDVAPEEYVFEEPSERSASEMPEFGTPATDMPDESEFDALPPIPGDDDAHSVTSDGEWASDSPDETTGFAADFVAEDSAPAAPAAPAEDTDFAAIVDPDASEPAVPAEETDFAGTADTDDVVAGGFTDDPVDTKLDLARAYLDMGDHEGAQAMLVEALNEGSQVQKEVAQKLLEELG